MEFQKHPLAKFVFCPICGSKEFNENNSVSKKCNSCNFTYYFNPRAATVAFIINSKNELLVARRAKDPAKGTLDLPGGFVDCFETAEQAIAREVLEETGLLVTKTTYLFTLPNIYPYSGIDIHTLDLFFLCQVDNVDIIKPMDDVAELMWINIKNLDINEFGLNSVKKGVEIFLSNMKNNLDIK